MLTRADAQIQALTEQSTLIKTVTETELAKLRQEAQDQTTSSQTLTAHAQTKFQELEIKHQELIKNAGDKFQEFEVGQAGLTQAAKDKFEELDSKMTLMGNMMQLLDNMAGEDVKAVRLQLAENKMKEGPRETRGPYKKEISEYKAIGNLEKHNTDTRTGTKVWLRRFKNAMAQSRGNEWERVLDRLEKHRVSEDFEELTTLDDKWEEWFEINFGNNRMDGKDPINFEEFKSDINWVLMDKLNEHQIEMIQKYEKNGMRAYKKLFTWSVDISSTAKQHNMTGIMNPSAAKSDEDLANHIEKWDQDRRDLLLLDPSCELKEPFVLVAFKQLLTNKMRDYVDNMLDPSISENYEVIRSKVYAWALKRRLEHKNKGGPMNNMTPGIPQDLPEPQQWPDAWDQGQDWWYPENHLGALGAGKGAYKGKGKGKGGKGGKGFVGECWNCGIPGHRSADCRKPPKGGGKGKGGPKGSYGKGKGSYGKGKGKGSYGKGMNSLGDSNWWSAAEGSGWYGAQNLDVVTNFKGSCYGCGEWGHSFKYCKTHNPNALTLPVNSVEQGQAQAPGTEQANAAPGPNVDPGNKGQPTMPLRSCVKTMNLGGSADAVLPAQQDLKALFENNGWFEQDKKGRNKQHTHFGANCCWNYDLLAFSQNQSEKGSTGNTPAPGQGIGINSVTPGPDGEWKLKPGRSWKELKFTVDSGACDHVINPGELPDQKVKLTEAVRQGVTYTSASGNPLPNLGEVDVQGYTQDGTQLNLAVQLADVNKPLAAVRKICQAGNRVVFDEEESQCYVENKKSGTRTPITHEEGTYAVKLWVDVPDRLRGNRFAALSRESAEDDEELSFGSNEAAPFGRPA
jgi:hypothetical protein